MKTNQILIITGIVLIGVLSSFKIGTFSDAQQSKVSEKPSREITVTGSSEMIVQPDQIELQITIHSSSEKSLNKTETEFLELLKEHNIDKSKVSFNTSSHNWYWYYWWSYRNRPLLRKSFYVALDGKTDMLKLMKALNVSWVENVNISKTSNSRIQELRQAVKMDAIKAAKDKAGYLLNGIDEKVGKVLMVEEINPTASINQPYWYRSNNNFNAASVSNSSVSYSSSSISPDIDNTQTIKLRYEILVKFEIE